MSRAKYRKIWEKANGPIPTDDSGRTYEIHHIDGIKTNDSIDNLQLLTIQEHYDIHYASKDYGSCWAISLRMEISPNDRAELLKLVVEKRRGVLRPDMIGDKNPMRNPLTVAKIKKILTGKKRSIEQRKNYSDSAKKQRLIKIECEFCRKLVPSSNYARWHGIRCLKNPHNPTTTSRHTNFTFANPSLIKIKCEHCGKTIGKCNYARWHGANCKGNLNVIC
jgi:hypothetical protein